MERIDVVAAVIWGEGGQLLISRRPRHLHKGGLWEFPGGKIEEGEDPITALARELSEELDILPVKSGHLMNVEYEYPEKQVFLQFFHVHEFSGQPLGKEGQEVRWIEINSLAEYRFPEANQPVVKHLLGQQANSPGHRS